MSSSHYTTIVRFYDGQHVFCTGATGMFGTVYITRLVLSTTVSRVYALVRGGEERLWKVWSSNLPKSVVQALCDSGSIVVFDGDITLPNCGLKDNDLLTLRDNATIFIHAASTINLTWPLAKVAPSIIYGSLNVMRLALCCPKLIKFTYISTVYSSTFLLRDENGSLTGANALVSEDIHAVPSTTASPSQLLEEFQVCGSTSECKKVQFYNSYSYAKSLTERLLWNEFEHKNIADKLILFRPSSVGPAEEFPFPFFELPGSCPVTTFYAEALTLPSLDLGFSSFLPDPTRSTYIEIPIDIAVNRLIAHVAYGTQGCVHCVPRDGQGQSVTETWDRVSQLRPAWLSPPRIVWLAEHWKADAVCPLGKVYSLCGTAFTFEETKSKQVWEKMSDLERSAWPFWGFHRDEEPRYFEGRKHAIEAMAAKRITPVLVKGFRL